MKKGITFLILLFVIKICSPAQQVLRITDIEEANESISDYIEVFCDTTNSIDFEQVKNDRYKKEFLSVSDYEDIISPDNTYWLHIIIDNEIKGCYPLGLKFPFRNNKIDIYTISEGDLRHEMTGTYINGYKNCEVVNYSNIIRITNSEKTEYYFKIKNFTDEIPQFNLRFVNVDNEKIEVRKSIAFNMFLQGMICLMIIYGLFLFFFLKENLYLYYTLYVFLIAIWFLLGMGFIYRINSLIIRELYLQADFILFLGYVLYISFIRSFIDIQKILPKWNKVLKVVQVAGLIFALINSVWMNLSKSLIQVSLVSNTFAFLILLILIIFTIRLYFVREKLALILALGSTFLMIGTLSSVTMFLATTNIKVFVLQKMGFLFEMIVFTFGISYRYWLIEKEKRTTQEKLIIQLNENAKLQSKMNRKLEEKVQERTTEVVIQKNEIIDSINYAQRIQTAILPPESYITELLHENFVFYKPRDIVSGDFYWIKQVNQYIVLVAADCTGHGVPGAFMSMLGISFLNEIVERREITQANQVLNELRKQIKYSLRQHGQRDESKDGMDMAICIINAKDNTMQYAGAFNPLYLIRDVNGEPELIETKADRMPVGFYHGKDKSFTNHEIKLEMSDTLYIFSDGFIDQIGGKEDKKYMSKNFKKLLLKIHEEPLHEQKTILEKTLTDWMDGSPQMDDILVVGVRI